MNGISERTHESYTADINCHIEVRIDDHMALQMDQAYWAVCGQLGRDWILYIFRTIPHSVNNLVT